MPVPSFSDTGTFNIRDVDNDVLVAKVHVETAAADVAGGCTFVIHWAIAKSSTGDTGWGVWSKPTMGSNKSWRWEPSNESLSDFVTWVHTTTRKPNLRYVVQSVREQGGIP